MDVPFLTGHPSARQVRDSNWVRRSLSIESSTMDKAIDRWRIYSTADMKFTDTSLGGNFAINQPPQYTPYADVRRSGISVYGRDPGETKVTDATSLGMGRFYSEQIDDHSQLVHMQFGVMKFRGMLTFFTGFYSNSASVLAREGRTSISYYIGRIAGAILTLPLWPFVLAGQAARYMMNRPGTKYAYFVPAMGPYWNQVNFIMNAIGVNMKLVAHVFDTPEEEKAGVTNKEMDLDELVPNDAHYREYMNKLAPSIFRKNGSVDMYAVANKAQRMANQYRKEMQKIMEKASSQADLTTKVREYVSRGQLRDASNLTIKDYLTLYHGSVLGSLEWGEENDLDASLAEKSISMASATTEDLPATDSTGASPGSDAGGADAADKEYLTQKAAEDKTKEDYLPKMISDNGVYKWIKGWGRKANTFLEAELDHGSAFVTFRVDNTGEQSESFSNQVRDPEIAGKINGMSATARSVRHSFSDGQTGLGAVDMITNSVKGLIAGGMDSIHISGLLALAGNAYVDIPQVWENSTASLPTTSFTMQLRTPYGHPIARYQNLYAPMSMILAAALPHSAGSQAYTTPWYCMMFSKGRQTIRLGMITEVSITRGVGNLGWTKNWEPLGFDIRFTVKDLSSVMHAPITSGFDFFNPFKRIFSDDNTFSDYLAALSSMDYKDQYYKQRQLWFNLTRTWTDYQAFFSTAQTTNMIGNSALGRMTAALVGDAFRTNAR